MWEGQVARISCGALLQSPTPSPLQNRSAHAQAQGGRSSTGPRPGTFPRGLASILMVPSVPTVTTITPQTMQRLGSEVCWVDVAEQRGVNPSPQMRTRVLALEII